MASSAAIWGQGGVHSAWLASTADTACFPATQAAAFAGNHMYYALDQLVPPGSEATVTVTPKAGVDVSLYGYLMGASAFYVPPRVPSVVSCEASNATSGTNPGVAETITFQNPPTNKGSYNLFFGVAGPQWDHLGRLRHRRAGGERRAAVP